MDGRIELFCAASIRLENLSCSVNGQLNGVDIVGQDLHCYVVTEDGRTYTAISRISDTLGWQMQVQYSTAQYSTVQVRMILVCAGGGATWHCDQLAVRAAPGWWTERVQCDGWGPQLHRRGVELPTNLREVSQCPRRSLLLLLLELSHLPWAL